MDRLSWVALTLALVFIGSCAEIEIGEGQSQFWGFLGFAGAGFALGLLSIGRGFQLFNRSSFRYAVPIFIAGGAGLFAAFFPFRQIAEAVKSPRVLAGVCEHPIAYSHIVLRQDGTAEDISVFWGRTVERGHYDVHGDTVLLTFNAPSPLRSKWLLSKNELRELPTADTTRRLWRFVLSLNKLSPQ